MINPQFDGPQGAQLFFGIGSKIFWSNFNRKKAKVKFVGTNPLNWNGQMFNSGNYAELSMEEFAFQVQKWPIKLIVFPFQNRGPIQGQDPLMSHGSLSNQLSPVIQWDQSGFSPGNDSHQ